MPSVYAKYKSSLAGSRPNSGVTEYQTVTVSKKPPTESEVLAQLRKLHPRKDIVLLEIVR